MITLLTLIIGATYAYFQASGGDGTSANLRVTTYTTDIITFEVGSNINIETNATLFSQGKGNASGTTFARATLTANNKTNGTLTIKASTAAGSSTGAGGSVAITRDANDNG